MAINKNFVVKHGLEVSTNFILANADTKRVGIGSTIPQYNLDVRGGIGVTDIYAVGVSTVLTEFNVGTGGTVLTALNSGLIGVGTTNPAYLLDIRSPVSTGQTALYVQGDVRVTGDLNVDDITFDSASLTSLEVTGIATIGTLGVIGLTTTQNLQVTGVSTFAGITTVTGETLFTKQLNVSGVSTLSGNVSFGSSALFGNNKIIFGSGESLEIGHSGSGAQIYNFGTGKLAIQSPNEIEFRTPTGFYARFTESFGVLLYDNNNQIRLQTLGAGVTVTGTTFTNQLVSSGVATASAYYIDGTSVINNSRQLQNIASLDATTTATIEAAIANGPNTFTDLNVTGITTLGTLEVNAGVLTATSGIITYYGDGQYLQNILSGVGIATAGGTVGTGATILDFRGAGISTVTVSSGVATINITGGGSGSASIGIGTTPGEAFTGIVTAGNLWYNSNLGRMFIYYQDNDGAQWVDASPTNIGIITSLTNVSFAAGSATSPSMYFVGDQQTGFFSPSVGQFTVVSSGSSILNVNSNGIVVTGISTTGRIGVGTTNPQYSLDVLGDINFTGTFRQNGSQFVASRWTSGTGDDIYRLSGNVGIGSTIPTSKLDVTGDVKISGVATAQDFDSLSDINYKENINTVNNALLKVEQLRGVKFNWKESGLPSYGVIAQELEEVLPELVHGNDPKTVNYNGIIGVLIEAIKELKTEINELKNNK